ncbi:MAG: phosphate signaling complex protein PhoU [Dehalococcoidia bacterium]
MARRELDEHMQRVVQRVLEMGNLVRAQIHRSVDALKLRDLGESQRVVEDDRLVDQMRFDIEEECIRIMATQQPVARDLRTLVATLNLIVDLERIGDHAAGIGKISLLLADRPLVKPLIDIPRMADMATDMLLRSLDAFLTRDESKARQVCQDDDLVDGLYEQVYRELLVFMLQDQSTIDGATLLLWVAHNLERIADRATNIAERAIYMATGHMAEVASKY